jgi:hypothetical protein
VESLPWDGTAEGAKGRLSLDDAAKAGLTTAKPEEGEPEVVVEEENHDFGVMDNAAVGSHDFVFRNRGKGTLKLTKGHTTCRCTMANLEQAEVPPGQSTKVNLEFKGKGFNGPYKQTATVLTNDPKRKQIELTVSGKIIPLLRAVPEEVVFSSVTAGDPVTSSVDLFDYIETPLSIVSHECTEKNTAGLFDVKWGPLKPEVLAKETGAKSGLQLQITLKPGLPVGTFKQTIRLKTNLPGVDAFEVPINGSVVSDLAIMGGDWSEEHSLLTIGTVKANEEASRTLIVVARGPFRDQVRLKVAEVWPDLLKVELGPGSATAGQTLRQFPIVIRIPKGTPPADHLGSETAKCGKVLLETNHPRAPKLLIRVRFAVEG